VASGTIPTTWPFTICGAVGWRRGSNHSFYLYSILGNRWSSISKRTWPKRASRKGKLTHPWVSGAFSSSHYALINFNSFFSGETGSMAILPWIIFFAWKLRNRTALLILILPVLFLFGSFIRHSFATHSICAIAFLWLEKIRCAINPSEGLLRVAQRNNIYNLSLFINRSYLYFTSRLFNRKNGNSDNPD